MTKMIKFFVKKKGTVPRSVRECSFQRGATLFLKNSKLTNYKVVFDFNEKEKSNGTLQSWSI